MLNHFREHLAAITYERPRPLLMSTLQLTWPQGLSITVEASADITALSFVQARAEGNLTHTVEMSTVVDLKLKQDVDLGFPEASLTIEILDRSILTLTFANTKTAQIWHRILLSALDGIFKDRHVSMPISQSRSAIARGTPRPDIWDFEDKVALSCAVRLVQYTPALTQLGLCVVLQRKRAVPAPPPRKPKPKDDSNPGPRPSISPQPQPDWVTLSKTEVIYLGAQTQGTFQVALSVDLPHNLERSQWMNQRLGKRRANKTIAGIGNNWLVAPQKEVTAGRPVGSNLEYVSPFIIAEKLSPIERQPANRQWFLPPSVQPPLLHSKDAEKSFSSPPDPNFANEGPAAEGGESGLLGFASFVVAQQPLKSDGNSNPRKSFFTTSVPVFVPDPIEIPEESVFAGKDPGLTTLSAAAPLPEVARSSDLPGIDKQPQGAVMAANTDIPNTATQNRENPAREVREASAGASKEVKDIWTSQSEKADCEIKDTKANEEEDAEAFSGWLQSEDTNPLLRLIVFYTNDPNAKPKDELCVGELIARLSQLVNTPTANLTKGGLRDVMKGLEMRQVITRLEMTQTVVKSRAYNDDIWRKHGGSFFHKQYSLRLGRHFYFCSEHMQKSPVVFKVACAFLSFHLHRIEALIDDRHAVVFTHMCTY